MREPEFPGAVAPERSVSLETSGVRLHLYEWGDPSAAPVLLCHGMFDHGRGFDLLAPYLAERFRVLALDCRGHGESGWADYYSWDTELIDLVNVLSWIGRPVHLVGHSRGGGQASDAAARAPDLVRCLVNIDGFGPPPEGVEWPGQTRDERSELQRFGDFLDWRRASAERNSWRPYPNLDDLVERRRAQNPRLSREWLRYFAFHGSRPVEGGRVWKADPYAGRGFGPWRPDWIGPNWRHLRAPMLAVTGSEPDTWGPLSEDILAERLSHAPDVQRATVQGAGHFVQMERPAELAELLLGFLEAS